MKTYKNLRNILFSIIVIMLSACEKHDDANRFNPSHPIVVDDFIPKTGSAGTQILIDGDNFGTDLSALSVTVNGIPLRVIGTSGKQIMAVVPKKLGHGEIEVSVGDVKGISSDPFTYQYTRTVTTLAGSGVAGFANGQGTDAMFNFSGQSWYRSMGIAVDDDLNVYVADPGNASIRKIDSLGNVTTLAGNPNTPGYADGQGTQARFLIPYDVTVDASGNVYSVDPGNWDVRKITKEGKATTIVLAQQSPWSVAVDAGGNVFYGSFGNPGTIFRIDTDGFEEPIISGLNEPAGIEMDAAGNLYAAISGEHVVRRFAAGSWESTIVAGQPGVPGFLNGSATDSRFSIPWGIALDAYGNVYVAGSGAGHASHVDQSIRYFDRETGQVSTFAGSATAGYHNAIGESASFRVPQGVCVDKNGTVYVLDKGNNVVRKIVSE